MPSTKAHRPWADGDAVERRLMHEMLTHLLVMQQQGRGADTVDEAVDALYAAGYGLVPCEIFRRFVKRTR